MAEWKERYNCHHLMLGGFRLDVSWAMTGSGYVVSFDRVSLKKRFASLPDAKAAALRLARRRLEAALDELALAEEALDAEEGDRG